MLDEISLVEFFNLELFFYLKKKNSQMKTLQTEFTNEENQVWNTSLEIKKLEQDVNKLRIWEKRNLRGCDIRK